MASNASPLTTEHCAQCNKGLESCAGTDELLEKMKACGIDVSELQAHNNAQREYFTQIKAQFFPNQP